jgi:hypothetical protein
MTMGRVDKNSTHEEIELSEKLQLHRQMKFRIRTCRVLSVHRVYKKWVKNK